MELLSWQPPFFAMKAHVSHGTYIRSLVNDIAVRAGSCATTYELERTAIGPFTLEDAVELTDLATYDDVAKHLIPVDQMLSRLALAS